jgi:ABC-type Zn uptake system ZnuABC Zn-binding protein ZnuA
MGDVHPVGNPHYTVDPGMAPDITANILEGLVRVAPQHRATFERSREQFLARLGQSMAKWVADLAPYKGTKVIVDHNMWPYFLTRFGLVQAGSVEERPGIPATPTHVTKLIAYMKEDKIKVIMAVPWADHKLAERIAQEAGARVVLVANGVGALKGTDTYLDTIDYNVKAVAQALK